MNLHVVLKFQSTHTFLTAQKVYFICTISTLHSILHYKIVHLKYTQAIFTLSSICILQPKLKDVYFLYTFSQKYTLYTLYNTRMLVSFEVSTNSILLVHRCKLSCFWQETYAFLPRLPFSRFGT